MLQSGFHKWQHRRVQRSGDQEPAHARMRKDSSSVAKNQRSKDSSSRSNKGGGVPVWVESAGGWVGLTLSVRISASAYGMQGTPHNEQAGSQNPLALHGFTKFGGPEKGGIGGYKPRCLKLIVCSSPYRATRN